MCKYQDQLKCFCLYILHLNLFYSSSKLILPSKILPFLWTPKYLNWQRKGMWMKIITPSSSLTTWKDMSLCHNKYSELSNLNNSQQNKLVIKDNDCKKLGVITCPNNRSTCFLETFFLNNKARTTKFGVLTLWNIFHISFAQKRA